MNLTNTQTRQSEQGFTLVELAIVMVIIGLLIGGILKGQELIANARVSSTVTQVKGLDAGLNTFQDKYNARAGDMIDAVTRLQGCVAPCQNGDGNSRIGTNLNFPAATDEGLQAFVHLSRADLISGIDTTGTAAQIAAFGKALPTVPAGGGMWLGYGNAAPGSTTLPVGRQYAVLNGAASTVTGTSGALTPTAAAQIDRKIDDGLPQTGSVQAQGTNCADGAGSNAAYNEAGATQGTCALYARVLN